MKAFLFGIAHLPLIGHREDISMLDLCADSQALNACAFVGITLKLDLKRVSDNRIEVQRVIAVLFGAIFANPCNRKPVLSMSIEQLPRFWYLTAAITHLIIEPVDRDLRNGPLFTQVDHRPFHLSLMIPEGMVWFLRGACRRRGLHHVFYGIGPEHP